MLTVMPLFFLVLLFPNGRLPSRRWRPVLWAMFVVAAGWAAQQLQAGAVTGGLTNALAAAKVTYPVERDDGGFFEGRYVIGSRRMGCVVIYGIDFGLCENTKG